MYFDINININGCRFQLRECAVADWVGRLRCPGGEGGVAYGDGAGGGRGEEERIGGGRGEEERIGRRL